MATSTIRTIRCSRVNERSPLSAALTLHVTHGHELGRPTVERVAASYAGDVLVFGHTHRPIVATRAGNDGRSRLVVNPGAAGPRRFDIEPTVALLTISRWGPLRLRLFRWRRGVGWGPYASQLDRKSLDLTW